MTRHEVPRPGRAAAEEFVSQHLGHLVSDQVVGSTGFSGGQSAATAALTAFDVTGYAGRRNEVLPRSRRGASRLSPYIRHGLIQLGDLWSHVAGGPANDVKKFRDELLWQEFARQWYARLGTRTRSGIRGELLPADSSGSPASVEPEPNSSELNSSERFKSVSFESVSTKPVSTEPGSTESGSTESTMACMSAVVTELQSDGWLVNQTRMWMASHWAIRLGNRWQEGEDYMFRHLLDGSRAANRLGWQWTTGVGSSKPYGFSRWQVNKRAPGLCESCEFSSRCPIEDWPEERGSVAVPVSVGASEPVESMSGPVDVMSRGVPDAVWLTAESLGTGDPAMLHHPDLSAVFVFDEPLLSRLKLSSKRLIFLVETLAELGMSREVELHLGDPTAVLANRPVAVTHAPVPGFTQRAGVIQPVEVHPWPWLVQPAAGSVESFSAWRRGAPLTR